MTLLSFMLPPKSDHRYLRRRARVGRPRCMWFLLILCLAVACSRLNQHLGGSGLRYLALYIHDDRVALAAHICYVGHTS